MFIFVVMFISSLVYLFNLVLLKIVAVAAIESDSGIGAVTHIAILILLNQITKIPTIVLALYLNTIDILLIVLSQIFLLL